MFLLIIVGKLIFNEILLELFFYINELINLNFEKEILVKYFVEKGVNIKEIIVSCEEVVLFSKKIFGNIIVEVFKCF